MLTLTILGDPIGKQRPRAQQLGKYIHIYTPTKTINYENYIKLCYLESNKENDPYLNGEYLKIDCKIYQAIPKSTSKKKSHEMILGNIRPTKKPDIDNILKVIFDSLNGLAYKDDTQIIKITAEKFYSIDPKIELKIYNMEEIND